MKKHRGGTSETTAWVKATKFRVPGVSPAAGKVIMMVLADYVDADGATWLGAKALAEMADVSERVVRRFISAAVEEKWICTEATKKPSGRGRGLDRLFVHVEGEALFCNCALAHDQRAKLADEKVGPTCSLGQDQPAAQGQNAQDAPLIPEPASEPATAGASAGSKPGHTNGQVVDHSEADAVLKEWWEDRKTAGNPVGQKFIACRGVVRSMIAQGVKPSRVAWALRNSPVCSAASLELAIQKRLAQEPAARDEVADLGRNNKLEGSWFDGKMEAPPR